MSIFNSNELLYIGVVPKPLPGRAIPFRSSHLMRVRRPGGPELEKGEDLRAAVFHRNSARAPGGANVSPGPAWRSAAPVPGVREYLRGSKNCRSLQDLKHRSGANADTGRARDPACIPLLSADTLDENASIRIDLLISGHFLGSAHRKTAGTGCLPRPDADGGADAAGRYATRTSSPTRRSPRRQQAW